MSHAARCRACVCAWSCFLARASLPRRGAIAKSYLGGSYLPYWDPFLGPLPPGFFLRPPHHAASRCTRRAIIARSSTAPRPCYQKKRRDAKPVPKNTPKKQAGTCPRGNGSLRLNPACSCQQKHVLGVTGMGIACCDECGVNQSH